MTLPDYIPAGPDAPILDSGASAAAFWRERVMTAPQFRADVEWVVTLLLDQDQRLLGYLPPQSDGARGWVTSTLRSVLRAVLLKDAFSVVVLHQHPSGGLEPSEADLDYAHMLLRWMEALGLTVFDCVIVDRTGGQFYSFREAGQFEARAAVRHDAKAGTYERALEAVLELMNSTDRRLQPLISEAAAMAGTTMPEWLANFIFEALAARFNPEPMEDRRLLVFSSLHSRDPHAAFRSMDAARLAGKGASEFVFDTAIHLLVGRFGENGEAAKDARVGSGKDDFNSGAVERVAAVAEST